MTDAASPADDERQVASDLVARIARGESAAEAALWDRYHRGLLFLLRRRTGDPALAEDLRQETFRIAIEKLRGSGLDEPERLAAYLRGIAVNLATGEFRKHSRRKTTTDPDAIDNATDTGADPQGEVARQQVGDTVAKLLGELGVSRDRDILRRYYVDEADKAQICGELDISPTHFNRVLYRAKQRFRELLLREERAGKLGLVDE
ncbi:MAG: RNA polymerase sigma factor [Gammaproteobacteria bacterium]